MDVLPRPLLASLLAIGLASASVGCTSARLSDDVPTIARGYKPHLQQVLDNIAAFTEDPGAWPSHVLVYKGSFETRKQVTGAVGTSTKLENTEYATTHWDLAVLDDPYDIMRLRLLYQWQVGHITFDELETRWNAIRDRPILDGAGKVVLGPEGKPTFLPVTLPITRQTPRDWITDAASKSPSKLSGRVPSRISAPGVGKNEAIFTTVWVADSDKAANFSLAVLSAMPNTRVKARWGDASMTTP